MLRKKWMARENLLFSPLNFVDVRRRKVSGEKCFSQTGTE